MIAAEGERVVDVIVGGVAALGLAGGFELFERFRNRDPKPIYHRLRDQGRQMPEGLTCVDSWIEPTFERCFQLMECDDARLLQQWSLHWCDVMEFEIVPVVPSKDTREIVAPHLDPAPPTDHA